MPAQAEGGKERREGGREREREIERESGMKREGATCVKPPTDLLGLEQGCGCRRRVGFVRGYGDNSPLADVITPARKQESTCTLHQYMYVLMPSTSPKPRRIVCRNRQKRYEVGVTIHPGPTSFRCGPPRRCRRRCSGGCASCRRRLQPRSRTLLRPLCAHEQQPVIVQISKVH